mgnify:CR=1 FL=1
MSLEVHIEKKLNGFTLRSDFTAGNTATAILGASGCGKSMTLRCIAGIVKPDKGRIVLDGRVLFDSEQHIDLPPQQRGVGLLFQNYALFPNMTVEQNILCGLKAERDKAARKARCAGILRALRLEELASRRPAELSGGQQQRTALARILVGKPKILMLDEPFSALDSYLREEVEGEVGSLLAGFDGTALLVTHNRDEAYRLCRDMIVMDGGQVLRTGTTKEVFADPGSTAAARLTGCKNILPCTRVDAHSVRLAGCESLLHLAAEVPEGCTAVGIRAHDFAPSAPGAENALPAELLTILENREIRGILDIGGDPVGARVLARFQPKIVQEDYQLIFVLNANRPEVRDAESAAAYLRSIEAVTGLTCSGLVNNTHLCGETTPAEIRKGVALAQEVSRQTGIPILCHTAERRFLESLSDLGEPVFPIAINMKKPWER